MADMVKKVKVFLIKLYGKEGKMETRKKGSHLNIEERRQIAILDKEGWSPYKIAKKLKRASNTGCRISRIGNLFPGYRGYRI